MLHIQSIKQNRLNNFFMIQFIALTPVSIYFIQFSKETSKYNVSVKELSKYLYQKQNIKSKHIE
jgi:hypothetical protein